MNKYDNSGAVFVNDRKEKDSHPDRTGSCTIDGREYWISGWIKSGEKGQFLSLAFKPKEPKSKPQQEPTRQAAKGKFEPDDSIPF
jgi:hypothetical protein